jgi:hypothetical protein
MTLNKELASLRRKRWIAAHPERNAESKRNWRQTRGREYQREYQRKLTASDPETMAQYKRNIYLKRSYKITLQEYEELVRIQNNRCAICSSVETGRSGKAAKFWMVDHCHVSGKVRGLLCHQCNIGVGNFRDDPKLLSAAISYVNAHRETK